MRTLKPISFLENIGIIMIVQYSNFCFSSDSVFRFRILSYDDDASDMMEKRSGVDVQNLPEELRDYINKYVRVHI